MVLMGGKTPDGIEDVELVNVGTEESPQWAIIVSEVDGNGDPVNVVQPLKIVTKDITSTDLDANVYTFSEAVDAVAVKNDGTINLTITISTLLFTIKPGESRILELPAFTVVTYSENAVFRMNGLRR